MYPQSQSWACSTSRSQKQSNFSSYHSQPFLFSIPPILYSHSFSSPHSLSFIRAPYIFSPKSSSFTTSSSNASWVMASENQKGGDDYLIPIESTECMVGESSKTGSTHDQMLNLIPMRPGAESSSSNAAKENLGGDCRTFYVEDRFFISSSTNQAWCDRVPRCYSEAVPNSFQCTPFPASNELGNHQHPGQESEDKTLKVILWKHLTKTDVGRTGRIIIPKGGAERWLPHLNNKDGMTLFMGDLFSGKVWTFKYRFWTNNNGRIYVIEKAGPYIRCHHLQKDDLLVIYKDKDSEIYYVSFSKKIPPPNLMDDKQDNANNQQLVRDGNETELRCQICQKPSKCLAHVCNLSTIMTNS